jgi:hypothetical protein
MRYGWLVGGVALLMVGSALSGIAEGAQSEFRVTLVGSGNPVPEADRFGPATLVEAGDQKLLFDLDAARAFPRQRLQRRSGPSETALFGAKRADSRQG